MHIIGHDENMIHQPHYLLRFYLIQIIGIGSACYGEIIFFAVPLGLRIQLVPDGGQQKGEITFVLRTVDIPRRSSGHRIFPVQIHSVKSMGEYKIHTSCRKLVPAFLCCRHDAEICRIIPASYGNQRF